MRTADENRQALECAKFLKRFCESKMRCAECPFCYVSDSGINECGLSCESKAVIDPYFETTFPSNWNFDETERKVNGDPR